MFSTDRIFFIVSLMYNNTYYLPLEKFGTMAWSYSDSLRLANMTFANI